MVRLSELSARLIARYNVGGLVRFRRWILDGHRLGFVGWSGWRLVIPIGRILVIVGALVGVFPVLHQTFHSTVRLTTSEQCTQTMCHG
ncbi:hypothetical protein BH23ACI1_BH23ACI1_16810 [soil metagenome]